MIFSSSRPHDIAQMGCDRLKRSDILYLMQVHTLRANQRETPGLDTTTLSDRDPAEGDRDRGMGGPIGEVLHRENGVDGIGGANRDGTSHRNLGGDVDPVQHIWISPIVKRYGGRNRPAVPLLN